MRKPEEILKEQDFKPASNNTIVELLIDIRELLISLSSKKK